MLQHLPKGCHVLCLRDNCTVLYIVALQQPFGTPSLAKVSFVVHRVRFGIEYDNHTTLKCKVLR